MVFDFVLTRDYFWLDFNLKLFEKIKKKNSQWQRRWGNVALFLVVTVVLFLKLKPLFTQLG